VIGAGGLGHIGIQCLAALTATNIVVVDRHPDALKLAEARTGRFLRTATRWTR
jgi:NAD+-dependent secondary alcohol dehydrogenase Adh1